MKSQWITILVLLALAVAALAGIADSAPADVTVYDDALASGWANWSWNTTVDFANAAPVHGGSNSIATTYTAAWGGLSVHADAANISGYDTLRFWLHGGNNGGQALTVSIDQNGNSYQVTATAGIWQEIEIPLSELGSPTTVSRITWQDNGDTQPTFYLDDIAFTSSGTPTPTPLPPGDGPALSVDVAADRHPISPYIYGMNFVGETLADELGLPVRRRGGNSTTRYNWQTDVHNTGSDWYYENIPDSNAYSSSLPDDSAADLFVEQDRRTGAKSLLTVPIIGWVPKPGAASHPYDCAFKVSKYGAQDSVDPWDTDCGNGLQSGTPITGNDPADTSVPITTTFIISWINHLTGKYGTAVNGGVMFYNLDNEPMLWNSTHRDLHPAPATYDEMRSRSYAYGAAIKAADSSAQTLGPVVWGWCAYFYSAADGCAPGSDRQSHGDTDFVPWYLQQMAAYEQAHGVRILDYLDLHIYPQVNGVYADNLGNAAVQAARLRSTRQLWDTTYYHEGWIPSEVYLIPRMRQWVADNYPGTKTAITEYNWGAHGYMNGALAQADLLGIFGRESLDLATLWGPPDANQPGAYAFRMYLNYDGQGSGFGETSIRAASADQDKVAIYAAQRDSDAALTLMVINKTGESLTSTISLANVISSTLFLTNVIPVASAQVYRYSEANLTAIVREADRPLTANGLSDVFPANSITLLVIPTLKGPDARKFVSDPLPVAGERVTYTIVIRNSVGSVTPTVLFTDTVPSGLSYVSGTLTATQGTVSDAAAPVLHWTGVLTPTPVVTATYAVTVTASTPQVITNTVVIAVSDHATMTRTAIVRVNWQAIYLPLVMRSE